MNAKGFFSFWNPYKYLSYLFPLHLTCLNNYLFHFHDHEVIFLCFCASWFDISAGNCGSNNENGENVYEQGTRKYERYNIPLCNLANSVDCLLFQWADSCFPLNAGSISVVICSAVQGRNAVSAYFTSKQILPFGFAEPSMCSHYTDYRWVQKNGDTLKSQKVVTAHSKSKQSLCLQAGAVYVFHILVESWILRTPTQHHTSVWCPWHHEWRSYCVRPWADEYEN